MTDESGKKKRTKLWAVIGVIVAIVIGITAAIAVGYGGAYLYFNAQAAKAYGVPLVVNAKGLDTDRGTKISVHATGKDSKDNGVDSVFYIGSSSSNIALKPGDYSLAIEASPIAEDGTIYDTKDAVTKVSIAKDGKTDVEKEITIEPIPAEEVTDEQIEAAYNAAKDSGIDASKLDDLKEKAQKRRNAAVAAKKVEEEKKAAEEKAAEEQKAAETKASNSGHSFMTDYFYVDVPSSWKSSEWSVRQEDDHTWIFNHQPANDYGGGATVSVAKSDPWPNSNSTKTLGTTGTGLNVYYTEAGAGFFNKTGATIELTKMWNPDDPNSVRADGFTNSDYQKIMRARERLRQEQTGKK